jgi:hypothetical protein
MGGCTDADKIKRFTLHHRLVIGIAPWYAPGVAEGLQAIGNYLRDSHHLYSFRLAVCPHMRSGNPATTNKTYPKLFAHAVFL